MEGGVYQLAILLVIQWLLNTTHSEGSGEGSPYREPTVTDGMGKLHVSCQESKHSSEERQDASFRLMPRSLFHSSAGDTEKMDAPYSHCINRVACSISTHRIGAIVATQKRDYRNWTRHRFICLSDENIPHMEEMDTYDEDFGVAVASIGFWQQRATFSMKAMEHYGALLIIYHFRTSNTNPDILITVSTEGNAGTSDKCKTFSPTIDRIAVRVPYKATITFSSCSRHVKLLIAFSFNEDGSQAIWDNNVVDYETLTNCLHGVNCEQSNPRPPTTSTPTEDDRQPAEGGTSEKHTGRLSGAVLGGIVGACIILALIVLAVVLLFLCKRKLAADPTATPRTELKPKSIVDMAAKPVSGSNDYEDLGGTYSEPYETIANTRSTEPDSPCDVPHIYDVIQSCSPTGGNRNMMLRDSIGIHIADNDGYVGGP